MKQFEVGAKTDALKEISAKAAKSMSEKLKGLKKSEGADKAKEILAPVEPEVEMDEMEESDEDEMTIEEIDAKIEELKRLKEAKKN